MADKTESPAQSVVRIILTGGPGGGKSSALATLRDHLSKTGYQVIVVPENSTTLLNNSGGYDAAWHGTERHVMMQTLFLRFQLYQEEIYNSWPNLRPERPHIILQDRGCLDGRLFCTEEQWEKVLTNVGIKEEDLLHRYDLIIHMTSAASGLEEAYDYGPGSSNPARYHTPEQARVADELAQKTYEKHPHVRVIPNFSRFSAKMQALVNSVSQALKVDGLSVGRTKELLSATSTDSLMKAWPAEVDCEVHDILVTFRDGNRHESIRKRSLFPRRCHYGSGSSEPQKTEQTTGTVAPVAQTDTPQVIFEYRSHHKYTTRRVLTPEGYTLLQQSWKATAVEVVKRVFCFSWQGHHFELNCYMDASGKELPASHELGGKQVLDRPENAPIPPWLPSVCEGQDDIDGSQESSPSDGAKKPPTRKLSRNDTAMVAALLTDPLTAESKGAKRGLEEIAESEGHSKEEVDSTPTPVRRRS
mmetsp:Transcript_89820/g.187753  ORF Transcript_89820/g.187753 Transcript_89820/m.187753 type:complete len:473 (+) Transcript_89820:65-1483(+)